MWQLKTYAGWVRGSDASGRGLQGRGRGSIRGPIRVAKGSSGR